jgi:hypothetical protein
MAKRRRRKSSKLQKERGSEPENIRPQREPQSRKHFATDKKEAEETSHKIPIVQIPMVIRSAAKSSLPIKNPSQNPISYRSKATKLKGARIKLNLAVGLIKRDDPRANR